MKQDGTRQNEIQWDWTDWTEWGQDEPHQEQMRYNRCCCCGGSGGGGCDTGILDITHNSPHHRSILRQVSVTMGVYVFIVPDCHES